MPLLRAGRQGFGRSWRWWATGPQADSLSAWIKRCCPMLTLCDRLALVQAVEKPHSSPLAAIVMAQVKAHGSRQAESWGIPPGQH